MSKDRKFKIINSEDTKGVWISETFYLSLIKISFFRNKKIYKKLVEDYEYLTDVKFEKDFAGIDK